MANNIAVAITADVADLQVKRAILSSELKAATKDLNDFAKTARTGGLTDSLRAEMLQSAESVTKFRGQIGHLDSDLKKVGEGEGLKKAFDSVFDRSRLAVIEEGSAKVPIFGGAIEALGPAGLIAAGGLAAMGFAAEKAMKAAEWAEGLKRAASTLGLTTTALQEFDFVFQSLGIDVARGRETLSGLEKTIGLIEEGAARKQQLQQFVDVLKITPDQLRGWGDLETQIPHIVDALAGLNASERAATESRLKVDPEVIQSLIDERDRIRDLIKEAHEYGIVIPEDVIDKSAAAAGKMHEWKAIIDGELRVAFIQLSPAIAGAAGAVANASRDFADIMRGAAGAAKTIGDFLGEAKQVVHDVDTAIPLLGDFDHWLKSITGGAGGLATALNHVINPLSTVIDLLKKEGEAGRASDELRAGVLAIAHGDKAGGPPPKQFESGGGKAKDDKVQQWAEQLHQQEVASNDFFGDQTAKELAFWQAKLALVAKGSKDWLAIQSKIYDAAKALAHQAYDDQIATLNVQLEADRDNWSKEKSDWDAKLAFIASKFGEESKEYKTAYREFEAAEREHQRTMATIAREANAEALSELKNSLATERTIREANARTAEAAINQRGKYTPGGDVNAARQVAVLHQQMLARQLADDKAYAAAADALLQKDINDAKAKFGEESEAYARAVNAKKKADQEFSNQHRALENQMVNQAKQDALKIQQAWHNTIDPMVHTTGQQFKGLIEGTETWGQALRNIGEQALSLLIDAIERMVEQWIVAQITGTATSKANAISQVASYAGVAGAAGVASWAGAPWPIDAGAPAFGASMSAAALAYGSLASLDVGTNAVPADMVALIHEGERIMPAADNAQLMKAIGGGGNTSNRGGDFHGDFGVTINGGGGMNGKDVVNALHGAQGHLAKLLKGMHRNGHFQFARG